ncbi:hypothetical protein AC578_6842 [Pseudocercospora eumusae]|uniref:Uncharacterized protein n=1 Tax=Pseudocercospora eumusae TaxID=321146 RepID=A0A139H761_9PEZI|nr:hypothetical protein AC578_6842 [Pseudocercospora eumusae]
MRRSKLHCCIVSSSMRTSEDSHSQQELGYMNSHSGSFVEYIGASASTELWLAQTGTLRSAYVLFKVGITQHQLSAPNNLLGNDISCLEEFRAVVLARNGK